MEKPNRGWIGKAVAATLIVGGLGLGVGFGATKVGYRGMASMAAKSASVTPTVPEDPDERLMLEAELWEKRNPSGKDADFGDKALAKDVAIDGVIPQGQTIGKAEAGAESKNYAISETVGKTAIEPEAESVGASATQSDTPGSVTQSSGLVWTSKHAYYDMHAHDDLSLNEFEEWYFVAHSRSSYGQAIQNMYVGQIVTVNGYRIQIDGRFYNSAYDDLWTVRAKAGWDKVCFQTCWGSEDVIVIVYGHLADGTAIGLPQRKAEYDRQMAEYDKAMEEYNRQMEEYNRKKAENEAKQQQQQSQPSTQWVLGEDGVYRQVKDGQTGSSQQTRTQTQTQTQPTEQRTTQETPPVERQITVEADGDADVDYVTP